MSSPLSAGTMPSTPSQPQEDTMLSQEQALKFLYCSRSKLYRMRSSGMIQPRQIGRKLLFSLAQLRAFRDGAGR